MGSFSTLERFGTWLVRDRVLSGAQRTGLHFLLVCVLVGAVLGLINIPVELKAAASLRGVMAMSLFSTTTVGLVFLLRVGVPLRVVEALEVLVVAVFLVFMSVQTAELHVEQLYWLVLLPLTGGLLLGRTGVWLGGVSSVLGGLAILGLYEAGLNWTDHVDDSRAVAFVNFASFAVTVGVLTALYEVLRARAVATADRAIELRAQFLASMSHELRTPMNGVLGVTQLLADTRLDDEQREYLALMHRSGEAMVGIINDVLDFSKLEAGQLKVDPRPTDVRALAADVSALFVSAASTKGVSVRTEVDAPAWLELDGLRLRQVLHNLVSNAVKFTTRGEVRVSLTWSGDVLRGAVKDEGIGMSPELLQRLFRPFEQADASTAREFGGTGLGLSITRELCRRMGGDVAVTSTLGVGSTFSFELRAKVCEPPLAIPSVPTETRAALHGKVLLVEDNAVNQLVARKLCERLGLEVELVEDGSLAVGRIERGGFSLVLMDCQMPVMDGYEATRRIRALAGEAARVPIIALTASALPVDLERCKAAGMNDVLLKPIDAALLLEVLLRHLPTALHT